jgi:hypothetical protein
MIIDFSMKIQNESGIGIISMVKYVQYDSVISMIQYDPVRYHQIIVFEACGGNTVVKLGTLNLRLRVRFQPQITQEAEHSEN